MNMESLADELEALYELEAEAKAADGKAKELKDLVKQRRHDLYHFMVRNDVETVRSRGRTFSTRRTVLSTITDIHAFEAWVRENGLEAEYLRPEVRKQQLNELVRERLDNRQELPPGTNSYANEYISTTER